MANTYGPVSVGTGATLILDGNSNRKGCVISNNTSATLYLGFTSAVTTTTGLAIPANGSFNNSGQGDAWRGPIYGIVASATNDVRYWEWEG